MSNVLIASVPIHGHVTPLLAVAQQLTDRGHAVRFLTGARFESAVTSTGATFIPLPASADFDDRTLIDGFDAAERGTGVKALRYDIRTLFMKPARAQFDALVELTRQPTDAVLVEPAFAGALFFTEIPIAERPRVVLCGVLPLMLSSKFTAPSGLGIPPLAGPFGRIRNAALRILTERVIFGGIQREVDRMNIEIHGRPADAFLLNWMSNADAVVQFSVPAFEYPRPDAPVAIRFAGPVTRSTSTTTPVPDWWEELTGTTPVVHVTQGTIANTDFGQLVRPTLEALADEDVLVVVSTGGRPVSEVGELPANARVAEYLPYDRLLPLTTVMVTNGGYGGVHYALEQGVPLVIAGDTEDKPEVSARVQWSGVGVNLKTGTPTAEAVRTAVRTVLASPRFREASGRAAAQIASSGGVDELVAAIEDVPARRLSPVGA